MADNSKQTPSDYEVDTKNLYHTETFTDMGAASIRRLSPVGSDGAADPSREEVFIGETTIMTQVGPLPVTFEIEANNLETAFQRFPMGLEKAIEQLSERATEYARNEASRIVVPTAAPPDLGGAAGPGRVPGRGPLFKK